MTWRAHFFAWFPAFHIAATAASFGRFVITPSFGSLILIVAVVYIVPPVLFRAHARLWPQPEGATRLDGPDYVPWWGGHQIQGLYNAFPALEALLRLIPGLYSAWLRLWGARIGRGVYWTARVEILDRGLLDVGDGVVFGHKSACYAHVIVPKAGRLMLYVRGVRIGARAFIGAGSHLGPGAVIPDGAVLPVCTDVRVNETFAAADPS